MGVPVRHCSGSVITIVRWKIIALISGAMSFTEKPVLVHLADHERWSITAVAHDETDIGLSLLLVLPLPHLRLFR